MNKKFFTIVSLFFIFTPSFAAYEEIECSTDKVFSEYSCNQCFDGGTKIQGDNLGLLTDLWVNATDVKKIVYDEEQIEPYMVNLSSSNVTWKQVPDSNNFWEYTDEFKKLYSEEDLGYILEPGKSVVWKKSTLGHAFNLEKNTAKASDNIGMLIYPIMSHVILSDGEVSIDDVKMHSECVLFKSGEKGKSEVVVPEAPKKLPQTGPAEYLMILFLSFALGLGIFKFRRKS